MKSPSCALEQKWKQIFFALFFGFGATSGTLAAAVASALHRLRLSQSQEILLKLTRYRKRLACGELFLLII
jgi:hypothetical protein